MDLVGVAALVGAQTNIKLDREKEEGLIPRQRAMLVWGAALTLGAVAAGSSLKILGKEHIQIAGDFTPYLMVIIVLIAFLGMGLLCFPFLRLLLPNRNSDLAATVKLEPTSRLKPELLEKGPLSVTEKTTEFLEASPLESTVRDTASRAE